MTNLSPVAKAVLDEMTYQLAGEALTNNLSTNAMWAAAAVLRQLADSVPHPIAGPPTYYTFGAIFQHIRALADELVDSLPNDYAPPTRPRPNFPNLKEQAVNELQRIEANIPQSLKNFEASCEVIRQALEALPND